MKSGKSFLQPSGSFGGSGLFFSDYPAIAHFYYPVAAVGKIRIMGHHQQGLLPVAGQFFENIEHQLTVFLIQIAGRP
jgi:hypothetical protein